MGEQRALVVALERYSSINGVKHARADGEAMAKALRDVGYDVPTSAVLIDEQATKATIESRLRTELGGMGPNDRFLFYFAGHGLAVGNKNYITCFDAQVRDLPRTSIPLAEVYNAIRNSGVKQAIVFLDSCHSGLNLPDDARSIVDSMSAAELDDFFKESEFYLCLASCKTDEESVSVPTLGHGVWTYHLLEALRGEAREVLTASNKLVASALQDFLSDAVPRTVRRHVKGHRQTPWVFGGATREALIADLGPIIEKRDAVNVVPMSPNAHDFRLVGQRKQSLKDLEGFSRSRHFTPNEVNDWTRSFVRECALPDIDKELGDLFPTVRREFGYTRKDIEIHEGDGEASLIAPDFMLTIRCEQHDTEPDQVVRRYLITELSDLTLLERPAFVKIFEDFLEAFELVFDRPLEIEKVIDAIEADPPSGVDIDYPKDFSYCELEFEGTRNKVRIDRFTMLFEPGRLSRPSGLVAGFQDTFQDLVSHPRLGSQFQRALSPGRQRSIAGSGDRKRLKGPT